MHWFLATDKIQRTCASACFPLRCLELIKRLRWNWFVLHLDKDVPKCMATVIRDAYFAAGLARVLSLVMPCTVPRLLQISDVCGPLAEWFMESGCAGPWRAWETCFWPAPCAVSWCRPCAHPIGALLCVCMHVRYPRHCQAHWEPPACSLPV